MWRSWNSSIFTRSELRRWPAMLWITMLPFVFWVICIFLPHLEPCEIRWDGLQERGIPEWVANWLQSSRGATWKQCVGLCGAFQHILQESGKSEKKRGERKKISQPNPHEIVLPFTARPPIDTGRKAAISLHHDSVYPPVHSILKVGAIQSSGKLI